MVGDCSGSKSEGPAAIAELIDVREVMDRMGGDCEILAELVGMFAHNAPLLLDAMRKSLDDGDAESTRGKAHALKGAICTFCTRAPYEAVRSLELAAVDGDLDRAVRILPQLETGIERLVQALHTLVADQKQVALQR